MPVSDAEYRFICRDVERAKILAVDTETTGLHTYQGDVLRGISVAYRIDNRLISWYVPFTHPESTNFDANPLYRSLSRTDALVLMHNAPFDIGVIEHDIGFEFPRRDHLYDTQVGDWLMDENRDHKLKSIGYRTFGESATAEQEALDAIRATTGRDWPTFTADDIAEYAAKDAELTLRTYEWQREHMAGARGDPTPALRREIALQFVLKDMMKLGIKVDRPRAVRQYQTALTRRDELRAKYENFELPDRVDFGVNMNSSPQVAEMIYDVWGLDPYLRTPGGARSTSKEALEPHAAVDSRVAEVLEHRRMDKACSGFYEPLARFGGEDGRIHASFSSARTVTGRLACSEPNLQTIPREDVLAGIRACFVPEDGWELWEYDLDSAELRIIGAMTKEPALFSAMAEGRKLHDETAAEVFGASYTDLQRRLAKNMNYGYPYGIGAEKLARYLAAGPPRRPMTPELIGEAKRMKQRYARTYRRMTAMMDVLADKAEQLGYLPLHKPGRFRRFVTNRKGPKYYTALNALVQGAVAEIMKDLMLDFERYTGGARLCLQVHDSIVCEVMPGTGELLQKQLQGIVDRHNPFPEMPMPISAKRWGS